MKRSKDGRFITGGDPSAHSSWKGGVQKMAADCTYLHDGTNKRVRRPRVVYAKKCELRTGECIYHIDGGKDNDDFENLLAVTRGELMQLNNPKAFDKDIQRILGCAIIRKENRMK